MFARSTRRDEMPDDVGTVSSVQAPQTSDADLTTIVFSVAPELGRRYVDVAGDFTAWAPLAMDPLSDGGFSLSLRLEPGRRWRYRFLLDGEHWMNDPNACEFGTCPTSGAVSVLHT
jgi:hypothetical protein